MDEEKKYRGSGGPPPPSKKDSGGGSGGYESNPFEFREELGGLEKTIKPFFVNKGEETSITMLDKGRYEISAMIHARFFANGHWNNYAVCRAKMDDKGCPLCDIKVGDPRWFLCGSLIDHWVWAFDDGRSYTNLRRLLLVHRGALSEFEEMEVDEDESVKGDWRGISCKVKRNGEEKGARIGTKWRTKSRLTEEEMVERYEETADAKEIPVEAYIAPIDYEVVLAPYSYEAMKQLADEIKAEKAKSGGGGSPRSGGRKSKSSGRKPAAAAVADEDDVPF